MRSQSMRAGYPRAVVGLLACALVVACGDGGTATKVEEPAALALDWSQPNAYNGTRFAKSPVVQLKAASGANVARAGVVVTVSTSTGAGRFVGGAVAVTRDDGRATFSDLGLSGLGLFTLRFSAPGLPSVDAQPIKLTEPAVGIIIHDEPTFVASGASLGVLRIGPKDEYGDLSGEAGLTITASIASGSGSLQGPATAVTDVTGVARFAGLAIVGTGPHTLRFASPNLPSGVSLSINVGTAPAGLRVTTQPSGVSSGLDFTTQPVVQLIDALGNPAQQRNVQVTAAIGSGGGTLYGTQSFRTDERGMVRFANLAIAGTGDHTLRFSSAGLTPATTVVVTLPPFEQAFGLDQFVLVKAGSFDMGSNTGFPNEGPVHRVTLTNDFYLQKTEVTQSQWGAVMSVNPSRFILCGGACPVEQVTFADIQEFIRRLNLIKPGVVYRLPTEAEWEYAARAGTTGDGASTADAQGWHAGNSANTTHPVARRTPNAWGLFDMLGNVREWVTDYHFDYPAGAVTNPVGPLSGVERVQRGDAWNTPLALLRIPVRAFSDPDDAQFGVNSTLGFRLVRVP